MSPDLIEIHVTFERGKSHEHMQAIAEQLCKVLRENLGAHFARQRPSVAVADIRGPEDEEGRALPLVGLILDPKARTLARGPRRYRRKVASPKQWQAIIAAKQGPCRVCVLPYSNGQDFGKVELHHVVARNHGGDDVADNIVPLHVACHLHVTTRAERACRALLESLSDAEYAYAIQRGGEGYFERAYGVRYER